MIRNRQCPGKEPEIDVERHQGRTTDRSAPRAALAFCRDRSQFGSGEPPVSDQPSISTAVAHGTVFSR